MPNTIAEYYTDELLDFSNAILFYNKEMDDFTLRLGEVIRQNSITGIAARIEDQQSRINRVSDKFHKLQTAIQQQQEVLKTDHTLIDNSFISTETENLQNELRRKMQELEKEYIDTKYSCYNFLSTHVNLKK